MKDLIASRTFHFKGRSIRASFNNGGWWFVAKNICDILDYIYPDELVIKYCDPEGYMRCDILINGEISTVTLIDKKNVDKLMMMKNAIEFQSWFKTKVLPVLRKTQRLFVHKK